MQGFCFFKLKLWLLRVNKLLWVKATYFALLAILTAVASVYLGQFFPFDFPRKIGAETVDMILNILVTSMLAVTTFSLTTVVSAYTAATSSVTPRATKLLMEDPTAQNVLSTFIGSFIFSLIAIIFLNSGMYDQRGRVVLFVVTLAVIAIILVTLIRWIEYLSRLGRVGETSELVERVAEKALVERATSPFLGGKPLLHRDREVPAGASAVAGTETGCLQFVDMGKLDAFTREADADVFVAALPGAFVSPSLPLVYVAGEVTDEGRKAIRDAFVVGHERNFEQDPRFGLCVLAEIAARALSPAVNDYGTGLDIIHRGVRLLTRYACTTPRPEVHFGRVWVPPLEASDLFADIFGPILRNEGGDMAINLQLMKGFAALHGLENGPFEEEARRYSQLCYSHACKTLVLDEDREVLKGFLIDKQEKAERKQT